MPACSRDDITIKTQHSQTRLSTITERELFERIMSYGEFDRIPAIHWGGWPETRERWIAEGLPENADEHKYFGADGMWWLLGVNLTPYPSLAEECVEDTDEYRIFRDDAGVLQKDWKNRSCIPHCMDFTLQSAEDWPDFKKHLQPHPNRIAADLDEQIAAVETSGDIVGLMAASMMGDIRSWMGVENMSYLIYDDPDCYADMVMTQADLTCWSIDQIMSRLKTTPDLALSWEDICGKTGPLVSPSIFDKYVAPGYRKVRSKLEECGVTIYGVDCDGLVEPLIPHWLDVGVNLQFPIEHGTWRATPEYLRRKFGRELFIVGGFNKLVLEQGRAAIDAEIARHIPLMREGGFIMMPDHLITPGTPLEDYKYYLERVRELRF